MLTFPKDTAQLSWTRHIKNKMVFYHLSGAQLLRIFRRPDRVEEGIAPQTIAAMKTKAKNSSLSLRGRTSGRGNPVSEEIWIMYKINSKQKTRNSKQSSVSSFKSKIVMISAWRYPGVTKKGERPLIPEDVLAELELY